MADTTTPIPHSQRAALLADRLADALAATLADSEWRDALAAQGQLHALLAVGEAIHAQTKMLRELLDPLGDQVGRLEQRVVEADFVDEPTCEHGVPLADGFDCELCDDHAEQRAAVERGY